ncbi:MAG: NAD-dependent epimerase/dehydratase [Bryobacterales bacterium]|nr:NAD-dependent epimerase/dehydratase [Bryobacterales bacterium]
MKGALHFSPGIRVIVTGGLGFIGSNLVLELLRLGARVTVIDPCVPGCGGDQANLGTDLERVEWIPLDIEHVQLLQDAISSARIIFNLAGEIRHQHSMVDPLRDLELNARSQLLFVQACARWNPGVRIVYTGSRQVYGVPQYLPVDEDHPVVPVDFNGIHKQAAASYHLLLSRLGSLDACVLHLTNVYGPRMAIGIPGQGFLGTFIRCLLDGDVLTVFGDGSQVRDPLHVDDAVAAMLLAGTIPHLPARVYNLGGPDILTLLEIAAQASVLAGTNEPGLRTFPPDHRQIDIGGYYADSAKIQHDLGWRAQVRFQDGLRDTLAWYRLVGTFAAEPMVAH